MISRFIFIFLLIFSTNALAVNPDSLDWRNYPGSARIPAGNYVTSAKDQGSCGSCWAFSTTGALESSLMITGQETNVNLSEQILVSCFNNSCNGQWPNVALDWLLLNGLPPDSYLPYNPATATCQDAQSGWQNAAKKPVDYYTVATWGDPPTADKLETALNNDGPLIIDFFITDDFSFFGTDTDYIYHQPAELGFCAWSPFNTKADCNSYGFEWIDSSHRCITYPTSATCYGAGHSWSNNLGHSAHSVLLVGYNRASSDPMEHYFIIKNSWGTDVGVNNSGFHYIGYTELADGLQTGLQLGYQTWGIYNALDVTPAFDVIPLNEQCLIPGTAHTIDWSYVGNPGSQVKVELMKNNVVQNTPISVYNNPSRFQGYYDWTVPANIAQGGDYKFKVTSIQHSDNSDLSDTGFLIGATNDSLFKTYLGEDALLYDKSGNLVTIFGKQ